MYHPLPHYPPFISVDDHSLGWLGPTMCFAAARRFLAEAHVDPWGLEGTGSNVQELGAKMGHGYLAESSYGSDDGVITGANKGHGQLRVNS